MKRINFMTLITITMVVFTSCNNTRNNKTMSETSNATTAQQLFPKGTVINNDYFSGTAWLQMLVNDKDNFDTTVGNVTFEPGVRNNWHSHPGGQILLCTKGTGYYQEKGKPIQLLHAGDVVEILPDIVHWHGASPHSHFEHIAISTQLSKGSVVWLDPVTDEEYNSFDK